LSAGLGGLGSYWNGNADALVAAGHRVVLYDQRGTGRSPGELDPGLRLDAMADDLWTLASSLGSDQITIVGHALGGVLGLCVAARAPRLIASVVVVNGFASPDSHFVRCLEVRLALLELGVDEFVQAQPIFLYPANWSSAHRDRLDIEARSQIEHFQGEDNWRRRAGALLDCDLSERLREVRAPVLLIAADDDMLVPSTCSEVLRDRLPRATLVRMMGGHACNITQPDRFDSILLGWLAGKNIEGNS
jgi:aminoacrylate hydrolase